MNTWLRMSLCLVVVSHAAMSSAAARQTDKAGAAQTGKENKENKEKKASDLTGRWRLVVTFDRGGGTDGRLQLTQQATKLTGSFTRTDVDGTVTGTLKGQSFTVSIVSQDKDAIATLTLTGKLEADGTLKGQASARTKGPGTDAGADGTFVATRRPSQP